MFLAGPPKPAKGRLSKWRQRTIEVSCNEFTWAGSKGALQSEAWLTPRKKRPDDSRYCEYTEESQIKVVDTSSQKVYTRDRDSGTCLARWLVGEGIQNTLVHEIRPSAPRPVSKALTPRPKDIMYTISQKQAISGTNSSSCSCSSSDIYCSTCMKRVNAKPVEIPHSKATPRDKILLPYTGNLLCNWSAVGGDKIEALIKALTIHWQAKGDVSPPPLVFVDLGCGDGRVVHQVCRAFPSCRGIGVHLNTGLIECANSRATKLGISSLCNFIVQDMAHVDLSEAGAVFLYLPKPNLTHVVSKVLPGANLRYGAGLFCAEDHLPSRGQYVSVNRHTEGVRLYCYEWRGSGIGGYCRKGSDDNSSSSQGITKHPKTHNAVSPHPTPAPPQQHAAPPGSVDHGALRPECRDGGD